MDFVLGFHADPHKNSGVIVFVGKISKIVHLVVSIESVNGSGCAPVFIDRVFRLHGLLRELVSDRDPRFTASF